MSVTTEAFFGAYGGRYVPEVLIPALDELERGWTELRDDPAFRAELDDALATFAGRPTPLTPAPGLDPTRRIYLKREDLCHTGAHKINNAIGQALLARSLGKRRIVAETGAGQHGVAVAAACARVGLRCEIYMGATDVERQAPNVERIRLLGAELHQVEVGAASLAEGRPVVLHGARTLALADEDGQVEDAHSIAAGLDYPAVGPEHAALRDTGRAEYRTVTDAQALSAFRFLSRSEGIIPALESAHAVAAALDLEDELVVVGLSGRGDKDLGVVTR